MPIFLGKCDELQLRFFGKTPDALIGKLRFSDFYFRDDFELFEVSEHCTSISVELTPWKTSVGKVPSH